MEGDVVLFELVPMRLHAGVVVGGGMVLHTTEKTGSILEPFGRVKPRVTTVYRVRETAKA